jgi:hypothetical protein
VRLLLPVYSLFWGSRLAFVLAFHLRVRMRFGVMVACEMLFGLATDFLEIMVYYLAF